MVKKTLLLLFGIAFSLTASAQTLQWLVKPDYDTISHLSDSVFKCKKDGKVQLINFQGKEILTSPADSVTNCSKGLALVLAKTTNGLKIQGIINETDDFTQVNGDYFVNQYSYFSEKLVSVTGLSGKAGYLNNKGVLAIPCQYHVARPFIKGWASVEPAKKKKQTIYIDHQRNKLKIRNFHQGKVVMGSSFNHSGEALIAYYGNDNAVIDTQGNVIRKYDKKEDDSPIRAYDFAFAEGDEKSLVPKDLDILSFNSDITSFSSGQLFGYKKNEHIISPPQFTQAGRFANGNAIVCQNGKFGIVKLADGSFWGQFSGDDLLVAAKKEIPTYTYTLEIPKSYSRTALEVLLDAGDGELRPVEMKDNAYSFTPLVDKNTDVCEMRIKVMSDGLLLWEDSMEKSVMNVSLDISTPVALTERANEQDILQVQSVITNNSDSPVVVSGAFYVTFAKGSNNKTGQKRSFWGKIAPKGKLEVFADLNVVEDETAKVSVTVKVNKKNIGSKSANIQLKPFY